MHIVKAGDSSGSEGTVGQLFSELSGAGADASHRDKSVFNLKKIIYLVLLYNFKSDISQLELETGICVHLCVSVRVQANFSNSRL